MSRFKFNSAAMVLLLSLLASGSVSAQVHVEEGDAGDFPATAQSIGSSTVGIEGTLDDPDDVDVYRVCLSGGKTFGAVTGVLTAGGSGFNTMLFLLDSTGRGVYGSDDFVAGSFESALPPGHELTPEIGGTFYLAITNFFRAPVDADEAGLFAVGLETTDLWRPSPSGPIASWGGEPQPFAVSGQYDIAFAGGVVECPPQFTVSEFLPPIEPDQVNVIKAGKTVAVKWLLTDANGNAVDDPSSFVSITSDSAGGICAGQPSQNVEPAAGASGLQYLGNGLWQFNWQTSPSYANQCRTMTLHLSDGSTVSATFQFK